ncbi:hypothetical protein PDESU_06142 [Pontiella desulfatans]|uniref:Prepilin-type N-terminal cleavage/methylation domain-containing protein n=1 Tax=Pontiella desulfatans TaxID=2750659 RepID=A0A6C2UBW4_PONDE|nr:prepilin-type N-terminal cleavage/methylation domain-containing protein [Pontiella desulfatans]VGO17545.1 hypothetical protein PDESU_06142 [Pontiella desulfatans]
MRAHCKRSGFSLVEMMVAILASSILALTVGSILYFSWMAWMQHNDSVSMQRDVSLTMKLIADEVRETPIEDISVGGSLQGAHGAFVVSGNDLVYKGITVIDGWLTGFESTKTTTNVLVKVALSTGQDNSVFEATFFSRN